MTKRDLSKIFFNEIYSKPPRKTYSTNKVLFNHIDEIWSINLADMIDYKILNNKKNRYIFSIMHNFSEYIWCIPLKKLSNKNKRSFKYSNNIKTITTQIRI